PPGFWIVRYSTKPGRTVPSANRNWLDGACAPTTPSPAPTTDPKPRGPPECRGRPATRGWSDVSLTETLRGVGTLGEPDQSLTLTVIREMAGTKTTSSVTPTAPPLSLEALFPYATLFRSPPGFWIVRYSTKPGRTVPSANRNWLEGASAPTT